MWFFGLLMFILFISVNSLKDYYEIFGISESATESEIKKTYRKLALEFHPDKIHFTGEETEEQKEMLKQKFLDIQEAYDVIGDPEKRAKYNLDRHGFLSESSLDKPIDKIKLNPFSLFARTKQMAFAFVFKFPKPEVIPIRITINVEVQKVFTGHLGSYIYYRHVICNQCNGNGGLNGTCRKCTLCDGSGVSHHIHHDHDHSYIHTSHGTCGTCHGKGCIPHEKCLLCSGLGVILKESSLQYELPPGFPNGFQIVLQGFGHNTIDGRKGNVELTFAYQYPTGWKQVENSLNLYFSMEVKLEELVNGWSSTLNCVNGEIFKLNTFGLSLVNILENGIFITAPGFGLLDSIGNKGNLIVEIIPSWEDMTFPLWIQLMQSSDIEPNSPYFRSLMKLYFLYAAHQPSEEDWELLTSSYSLSQWNQTDISIEDNLRGVYSMNTDDIIINTDQI